MKPRYEITTLDPVTREYSKQFGCPRVVRGFAGLRRALRTLRQQSFLACRGDNAVRVQRLDNGKAGQ